MATQSTNLQLVLPEEFDNVDINVLVDNFIKIDAKLGQVANDLQTTEAGWFLDARQGKVLNETIQRLSQETTDQLNTKLPSEKVVNNATTTQAGYALDARQGKALADLANGKASKTTATATLAVESWEGSGPYTQTVNVSGVTASNAVVISPAPESFKAWGECGVYASVQAAGKLTFTAEDKPDVALVANVMCVN